MISRDFMIEKRINRFNEYGLFAHGEIEKGSIVFTHDDWVEDEKRGWFLVSLDELSRFSEEDRRVFLKYCYDVDFGMMVGTLNPDHVRHLSNFINHSCDPNTQFDLCDNIIARRRILPGEEITIDYATFVVNADQDFICGCGSPRCRKIITKDDWKLLLDEYGFNFPTFMHPHIEALLRQLVLR